MTAVLDVSVTAAQVYADLGPALAKDDLAHDWPLLSLIDALTIGLVDVDELVRDGELPGWTVLFDLDRCPARYLPWLAQWAGVRYDPALPAESNRSRIRAREGATAGTVPEMIAAARAHLAGGSGVVHLLERDTGPHHVTVQTYQAQTPDPDALLAALIAVKPARVLVDLQVLASATYDQWAAAFPGTWNDPEGPYLTYDDEQQFVGS